MTARNAVLEQFKRGGAGFTFAEWTALSADDQAAAIEIQGNLDREKAATIAYFLTNPKAMFDTLAGGDAVVRAVLEGVVR